jgi:hypothetical protein
LRTGKDRYKPMSTDARAGQAEQTGRTAGPRESAESARTARTANRIAAHVSSGSADAGELWLGIGRCVTEGCEELTTGTWCAQCEAEGRAGQAMRQAGQAGQAGQAELPLRWIWLAAVGVAAGMYAAAAVTWWEWVEPWVRRW